MIRIALGASHGLVIVRTLTGGSSVQPVIGRSSRTLLSRFRADESGEGVISAAIAVLVMAFIGVAMWIAFSGTFQSVADTTEDLVGDIGS